MLPLGKTVRFLMACFNHHILEGWAAALKFTRVVAQGSQRPREISNEGIDVAAFLQTRRTRGTLGAEGEE